MRACAARLIARCRLAVWSSGLPARTPIWLASNPKVDAAAIGAASAAGCGKTLITDAAPVNASSLRRTGFMALLAVGRSVSLNISTPPALKWEQRHRAERTGLLRICGRYLRPDDG